MTKATQDGCPGKLATPLGKDVLLLASFEASEAMGELFEIRIDALSEQADIDFDKALGQNCSIHLKTTDDAGRDFSGVLTEARSTGRRDDFYAYSLVLRPWLWLLSLTSDCCIFPNMDPKQIIKQVFEDRGFTNVLDLAVQNYPTLEYTVQYRETDLAFVLRLMEEYGIYYYFQFEPSEGDSPSIHYLVLADSTAHARLPKPDEVVYLPTTVSARRDAQQFNDWKKSHTVVTGVYTLNDYDYNKPPANLLATKQHEYKFEHGDMEIYDYPGDYDKQDEGANLAQVRVDTQRTPNLYCDASGSAPSLTAGYVIKRRTPSEGDTDDGDYLIVRCSHAFGYQSYEFERRRRRRELLRLVSPREERYSLSHAPADAQAGHSRDAIGSGYRQIRRGNRRRRGRAHPRAVLLGPQEEAVAQGPHRAGLGGKGSRRVLPSAHW